MKANRFELEVDGELESLPVISDFVTESTKQLDIDQSTIFNIHLAVDEACTNVIKHAYSGQKGTITVVLELVDDDLIITIRDYGKPFEPSAVSQPDLEADWDKREVGGLGIYFMRKLMDDVTYTFNAKKGNELTLRKRLPN